MNVFKKIINIVGRVRISDQNPEVSFFVVIAWIARAHTPGCFSGRHFGFSLFLIQFPYY